MAKAVKTGGRNIATPDIQTLVSSEQRVPEEDITQTIKDTPAWKRHPVMCGNYTLMTNEMVMLYQNVKRAITTGYSGVIIYGDANVGKTRGVNEIRKWLKNDDDLELCDFLITLADKNYKYKEFYQYFSEQIGCTLPQRTNDTNHIVEHLLSHLTNYGKAHNNTVVFILDEAEHLLETHYNYLKFIYNRLATEGVRMITFLVGTERLLSVKREFQVNGDPDDQITRRFMQEEYEYKGIIGNNSLSVVLGGFDEEKFNDLSFTEFFFPEAYAKGCRLVDLTDDFHNAMTEVSGLQSLPAVPIGRLLIIVNALFQTYGKYSIVKNGSGKTCTKEWIDKKDIKAIMLHHNFHKALLELTAREHKRRGA